MLIGKPSEWVGRRFRNIHTGGIYEVDYASFNSVGYHDINDPEQRREYTHWRGFKSHWEHLPAAQGMEAD